MSTSEQTILKEWIIPRNTIDTISAEISIAISEDKEWWWAAKDGIVSISEVVDKKGKARFSCETDTPHDNLSWEKVRQHLIKELLPTLEPLPIYSDLDRFTNLE